MSVKKLGPQARSQDPETVVIGDLLVSMSSLVIGSPLHYRLRPIKECQFRFANFASHFIRIQIFQIDFPLILSASKYFRQISMSFYICMGRNELFSISLFGIVLSFMPQNHILEELLAVVLHLYFYLLPCVFLMFPLLTTCNMKYNMNSTRFKIACC